MEKEYLMTDKNLQIIDMRNTLHFWAMNDNNFPMSNLSASYSATVYYQYEANWEFQTSGKSLKLWEGKKNQLINFNDVPEFKINNKSNKKRENVYAIKVVITQTLTDEKTKLKATNDFDIRIRRNKGAIIMEKYNPESNKFELVQTEIFTNYKGEGECYHKIENLKTDAYDKRSYVVETHDFQDNDFKLIQSIYVDESSISDLFSHHIGKTILFILAAIALGLTWYLIPALALAMQISLAVCFVLFVALSIIDEKKNFLPSPKKIFCGLILSEKDDDPEKKREEKDKEEPEKKLDEEDKESEISD